MSRFLALMSLPIFLNLASCTSTRPKGADVGPRLENTEYIKKMAKKTQVDKKYSGFSQLYEAHVTLIDSDVQSLVLQRKSDVYQWNIDKAQKERERMFQENSSDSKFFVVVFTPRAKLTDLHRGTSMWKVYLDLDGQRYEAKIKKVQGHLETIKSIYPSLNRFSVPYEVRFDVPLSAVEEGQAKFIMTSALGTTEMNF